MLYYPVFLPSMSVPSFFLASRRSSRDLVFLAWSSLVSHTSNIVRIIKWVSVLRIRDVYQGPNFFHPGSASKFKYFNPGSWIFTHPESRIQGSKRHRILDPGSATLVNTVYWLPEFLCRRLIWGHPPPLPRRRVLASYTYSEYVQRQRGGSHSARERGGAKSETQKLSYFYRYGWNICQTNKKKAAPLV